MNTVSTVSVEFAPPISFRTILPGLFSAGWHTGPAISYERYSEVSALGDVLRAELSEFESVCAFLDQKVEAGETGVIWLYGENSVLIQLSVVNAHTMTLHFDGSRPTIADTQRMVRVIKRIVLPRTIPGRVPAATTMRLQ
jgi:hypothetical protein